MDRRLIELSEWFLSQGLNGRGAVWAGEKLCEKLLAMGIPLCRAHVLVLFLHPLYHARSVMWRRGEVVQEKNWPHGLQSQPGWTQSTFYAVIEGEASEGVHADLRDPCQRASFPMFEALYAEGITEYLALPMCFSDGTMHALSFATDAEQGFSAPDSALLKELGRLIAVRLESAIRRELSYTVLSAYLGRDAARRVLEGRIRREDSETISAAVWMSDLRGFTALSDRLPAPLLLELLGDYFTVVVEAVRAQGGEVLKFIGDAVLAIFRVDPKAPAEACDAALRAARAVDVALCAINASREHHGKPLIQHGVGLHVGQVSYGNVGSSERLDFTVIGPAVNMTARIESLCGRLEQSVVMSESFATQVATSTVCLGSYHLKGMSDAVDVYGVTPHHEAATE